MRSNKQHLKNFHRKFATGFTADQNLEITKTGSMTKQQFIRPITLHCRVIVSDSFTKLERNNNQHHKIILMTILVSISALKSTGTSRLSIFCSVTYILKCDQQTL